MSKEAILERLIAWKVFFLNGFYAKFFPLTAQDEMEQRFIELKQEGEIVDTYVVMFSRLRIFAPSLVTEKRDKTCRFQQCVSLKI